MWVWFNKTDLQDAYGNSTLWTGDYCYSMPAYTSRYPTRKRSVSVCFQGSQRLLIMLTMNIALNDTLTAIYGELSSAADNSLALISLMSRGGMNVFVRNRHSDSPFSYSCVNINR
jgi:hypothetical protein